MPAIAFYAPLKSPDHPNPSGDRQIARLLLQALQNAGYDTRLVSQLRSFDKSGNPERQAHLIALADKLAQRIIKQWQKADYRPDAWFTYHLYYKAPDLLGPAICRQLNIPYFVCEASWAEKRANGPWQSFHQRLHDSLQLARSIFSINPVDSPALNKYFSSPPTTRKSPARLQHLPLFIDTQTAQQPARPRGDIARQYSLETSKTWLVTIAMMRDGDKLKSYELLAEALSRTSADFQLLIIGNGKREVDVHQLFSADSRVRFAGRLDNTQIMALLPHFAINIWPAVNEALGMSFLESQLCGSTVIAGNEGGVHSVVADQVSGILTPAKDTQAMATAIDQLITTPDLLAEYQSRARDYVLANHSLASASQQLKQSIDAALEVQK